MRKTRYTSFDAESSHIIAYSSSPAGQSDIHLGCRAGKIDQEY